MAINKGNIMKKHSAIALAILLLLALSGCASTGSSPSQEEITSVKARFDPSEEQIERAKQNVKGQLKDPQSAQFERMYGVKTYALDDNGEKGEVRLIAVCGYVNARNSFGGYTGRTLFTTNINSNSAILMVSRPNNMDRVMNDVVQSSCSYDTVEE